MRYARILSTLPLLGGLLLVGCRDGGLTAPLDPATEVALLTQEDAIALDVLSFGEGVEAALALAEAPLAAAGRRAMGNGARAGATNDAYQARLRFQDAAGLLQRGDSSGAAVRAREARRLVVRAGQAGVGRFAAGMVDRIDALSGWVAENPGSFVDPVGLGRELSGLAEEARRRLHHGDSLGAGDRGVLAEQRTRQRRRDGDNGLGVGGAEVSVALGASAVSLAVRLLDEQGADDEQLRYLDTALEYQRAAEAALEAGAPGRAIHLAHLAEWTALKAVVLPGGVTDEEARAILALAESLYADAAATSDLTDLQTHLLDRARALLDHGAAALESGSVRGVVPLWRAAVICSWISG